MSVLYTARFRMRNSEIFVKRNVLPAACVWDVAGVVADAAAGALCFAAGVRHLHSCRPRLHPPLQPVAGAEI